MTKQPPKYSFLDQLCISIDQSLRTLFGHPITTERISPAHAFKEVPVLTEEERQMSARLMRVNHAGEVCAQALYVGQALMAKSQALRFQMKRASLEENDHLLWCAQRLAALNSHTSYLNPLWYTGALCLGIMAGVMGDGWSLGFLAETEHQVVAHLTSHQARLPKRDVVSEAIIAQMRIDEEQHKRHALASGAYALPDAIKQAMRLLSRVMTTMAQWI